MLYQRKSEDQHSARRRPVRRRTPLLVAVAALGACLMALTAGPAEAAPRAKLPETFNFLSGIPSELAHPGGSLPGSNDFTCKPTAAHPRPVVLLHGTGGSQQTNWGAYVATLANRGYCVFAMTYGAIPGAPWPVSAIGGMRPIEEGAGQMKRFVDRVLAATGARTVDIVGHSQGTYMPTYYMKYLGGQDKISNYVSLAPLWHGTMVSSATPVFARAIGTNMPICNACGQVMHGSEMNKKLWRGGSPYVKGVAYTNISTRYDEFIMPYTSGQVPGRPGEKVRNIVVQDSCAQDYSDHAGLAGSRRAAMMVLNALDPEHPVRVPCEFVPPFTG